MICISVYKPQIVSGNPPDSSEIQYSVIPVLSGFNSYSESEDCMWVTNGRGVSNSRVYIKNLRPVR